MAAERVRVELLYLDGCPGYQALLPRLDALIAELGIDARIQLKRIESAQAAEHDRFLGSPTVRVNGADVEPSASERSDYGLKCRLYPSDQGPRGDVPDRLIRAALNHTDA
jgi:hypothetical protein